MFVLIVQIATAYNLWQLFSGFGDAHARRVVLRKL
jgi:hypothetical protein